MEELKENIIKAIKGAGFKLPEDFSLESPPNEKMGDLATNVAIIIAKNEGVDPKDVSKKILGKFSSDFVESVDVAVQGFINFKLSKKYYQKVLSDILSSGGDYGKSDIGKEKRVLVEYVSANPTGPLHIGNARGGPIGETISNIFSWLGYYVEREFYVNDVGAQIRKFGETLAYYYISKNDPSYHFPEGGYPGDFLKEISEQIQREKKDEIANLKDEKLIDLFIRHGLEITIRRIKEDLSDLGIVFDRFQYESDLINSGLSQKVIEDLKEKNALVDREGALWFCSKEYSDLSDRESVLVRSDSEKSLTYFASDIAYHKDKFDRKFDRLIDIWGANHHGHIERLKASLKSLGYDSGKLDIILYQNVRLKKNGETKQMGKRLGNFINISDLLNEMKVSADVFKYTIISQSSQNIIDFDLDLAVEQSEKNPVYYLQYAYARICSILRNTDKNILQTLEKIAEGKGRPDPKTLDLLKDKKELDLIKLLDKLPNILLKIGENFQIQSLPFFATETARAYHNFYTSCKVLSSDKDLTEARLLLVLATRNVLKITLSLMDVSAPERM